MSSEKQEPVVLSIPHVPKVSTQPNNERVQDSLLSKVDWTRTDLNELDKILAYYLDTRYGGDTLPE